MSDAITDFAARIVTMADFIRREKGGDDISRAMINAVIALCAKGSANDFETVCVCVEISLKSDYISRAQYDSIMRDIERIRKEGYK